MMRRRTRVRFPAPPPWRPYSHSDLQRRKRGGRQGVSAATGLRGLPVARIDYYDDPQTSRAYRLGLGGLLGERHSNQVWVLDSGSELSEGVSWPSDRTSPIASAR